MGNRNSYGRKPREPKHKATIVDPNNLQSRTHTTPWSGDPKQYTVSRHQLSKKHAKYRPKAGTQRHTKSVHLDGKWKQRHDKQPVIIGQCVATNSELRRSNDGVTRVWTDKKWTPKGNIPKGF